MFKLKKQFLQFFLLIIVAISSCDGRDKVHRTTQKDLIENKVLDTFTGPIKIFPETYFEFSTDTIFSNGYQLHTKFYSSMENGVLVEDNKKIKTYFRNILVAVKVSKNEKEIFNNLIDKSYLTENKIFTEEEAKTYVIKDYWIESPEEEKEFPVLVLKYKNPKSKNEKLFRFNFPKEGLIFEEII